MTALSSTIKGMVIAAPASGSGKTTFTLGLLAALAKWGICVAPFKIGPDFIDPGHHTRLTGRISRNLDGWMLDKSVNQSIFFENALGADVAVVEGVMGLYDGYDGHTEAGSTAQMAKWLNLPVLLVVDAKAMARSFAALVKGFAEFDPELDMMGVVANNVASDRHLAYLRQAMADSEVPLIGGIPRNTAVEIPDRHLGLYTADDHALSGESVERLAELVENHMDLAALVDQLPHVKSPESPKRPLPEPDIRIGVARDNAFCFYYADNLDMLRQQGAEIVFFSPMQDTAPPCRVHGLYFGGGYPELFAERLAGNQSMLSAICDMHAAGMPIYGECGGFMYLCAGLTAKTGESYDMAGIFPYVSRMQERLAALGYREIRLIENTPIGSVGTTVRGHEFHYSQLMPLSEQADGVSVYGSTDKSGADRGCRGWLTKRCLGSYVHLHFKSNPAVPAHFAEACRSYKTDRKG